MMMSKTVALCVVLLLGVGAHALGTLTRLT